jgi:hypothetical protein
MKLTGNALKFFKKVGSKGGRNRAKNYSRRTLKHWASLGGRPARSFVEQASNLRRKFEVVEAWRQQRNVRAQLTFVNTQARRKATFETRSQEFESQHAENQAARKANFEARHRDPVRSRKAAKRFKKLYAARDARFAKKQRLREQRFLAARASQRSKFLASQSKFKTAKITRRKYFETRYNALLEQDKSRAA